MAKVQRINGKNYIPRKAELGWPLCALCGSSQWAKSTIYSIENEDPKVIYCLECVSAMRREIDRKRQMETFSFSHSEPLYIGKAVHGHDENQDTYELAYARFSDKRNESEKQLKIWKCTVCKKYFVEKKVYEDHRKLLCHYHLISTATGERILPGATTTSYTRVLAGTAQRQHQEIPSSVSWYATHPYKGGKVSPK